MGSYFNKKCVQSGGIYMIETLLCTIIGFQIATLFVLIRSAAYGN